MIKIIYRELSPGLHASAETAGRDTIISLLPGLTPEQRRAALRRLRHSGRMGHGPRVSAVGLRLALGLDRIKATTRTGVAVVRLHPAGSTLPVVLLSAAAVVFVLMATVSIHVLPGPKSSDQSPVVGGVTPVPTSSASRSGQQAAPPAGVSGHAPHAGSVPSRLASGQHYPSGSAAAHGRPAVGTSGPSQLGSLPSENGTGTGLVTVTSPGSAGSGSSGTSTSAGTGTTGHSGSAGSGTSAGSSGSSTGSGTTTTGGGTTTGSGSGSGTTSPPAGTGTSGSGTSGSGTGTGSTGTGTGSTGTGTGGSGSTGTGSTGSGSGSSGGSGSGSGSGLGGGVCVTVTLLSIQACVGR